MMISLMVTLIKSQITIVTPLEDRHYSMEKVDLNVGVQQQYTITECGKYYRINAGLQTTINVDCADYTYLEMNVNTQGTINLKGAVRASIQAQQQMVVNIEADLSKKLIPSVEVSSLQATYNIQASGFASESFEALVVIPHNSQNTFSTSGFPMKPETRNLRSGNVYYVNSMAVLNTDQSSNGIIYFQKTSKTLVYGVGAVVGVAGIAGLAFYFITQNKAKKVESEKETSSSS